MYFAFALICTTYIQLQRYTYSPLVHTLQALCRRRSQLTLHYTQHPQTGIPIASASLSLPASLISHPLSSLPEQAVSDQKPTRA